MACCTQGPPLEAFAEVCDFYPNKGRFLMIAHRILVAAALLVTGAMALGFDQGKCYPIITTLPQGRPHCGLSCEFINCQPVDKPYGYSAGYCDGQEIPCTLFSVSKPVYLRQDCYCDQQDPVHSNWVCKDAGMPYGITYVTVYDCV